MWWYIFLFIISFLITFFLTPYFARFAKSHDAIDKPGHRKVHRKLTPLWGGLAIYSALIMGVILLFILNSQFREIIFFSRFLYGKQLLGLCLGAAIIVIVGAIDDKKSLPPKVKLAGQLVAAITAVLSGMQIAGVNIPFTKIYISFFPFGGVLALIWIVSLINAFNFVDGLDGLASGIALISVFSFFIISIRHLSNTYNISVFTMNSLTLTSYLSIIIIGSLAAFLIFNFHPAKIFLGDSGAMLLGFLLASITVIGSLKKAAALAIVIPILIMSVPLLDIVLAVIRRIKERSPISMADKSHLHHRLLGFGFSHRQVVIILYFLNALLAGFAILIGG